MTIRLIRVEGPAADPVNTDQAKTWLRARGAAFDVELDTVADLIKAATAKLDGADGILNPRRCLMPQTWDAVFDGFPDEDPADLVLPLVPIISITSVGYLDHAGETQTIDEDAYRLVADDWESRLVLPDGSEWPTPASGPGTVTVRFVSGYASADELPPTLRQDVLTLAGYWFDNREKTGQLPPGWSSIYKRLVYA